LAIISPTSGGRSVGIVRSRTQTMEFFSFSGGGSLKALPTPLRYFGGLYNETPYRNLRKLGI
jgi:hypothetical protein